MKLLVCSLPDEASVNIRQALLGIAGWAAVGEFEGREVLGREDSLLVQIDSLHLYSDGIDHRVRESTGLDIDDVIFLSRHRAASGIHTLTVHPIGNYEKAELGGRDRTLVPSSPRLMTGVLKRLTRESAGTGFKVSFEVTHHGPHLDTPALFVEIGSDESMWGDKVAARAVAASVLSPDSVAGPVAIGVGDGHYAPRFSEVILTKEVSFGHMIPNYAIENVADEDVRRCIEMARDGTKGAECVYIQRKSMKRSRATSIRRIVEDIGLRLVDSDELADAA